MRKKINIKVTVYLRNTYYGNGNRAVYNKFEVHTNSYKYVVQKLERYCINKYPITIFDLNTNSEIECSDLYNKYRNCRCKNERYYYERCL